MDDARARRLATNEALARDVNERVAEVGAGPGRGNDRLELVCECSLEDCNSRIHLSVEEYRRLRLDANQFALIREHVVGDIERIVGEAGDAVLVAKLGPSRNVAEATA